MLVQKEKNVVKIRFDDESYIITPSLKQWDKGQILKFLDIDDGAIVQFGTKGNSYVQNGQVEIPDFLMEKEGQTIIYVRLIDENSETTVKKVIIPINPKYKPKDYIEPENEQSFIQQVSEIMNETKAEADEVYEAYQRGDLNGRDGQDGAQGPQGERGPKGDKGDKGDTGEQGAQGIQGQQGEKGEKGERGEQGQKGETGTQGPPGEDYILTQSDKEEIASIAADMVPQYDDTEIREEIEGIQKDLNLKIIQQPPATIVAGVSNVVSLSVVAVGDNLTYQWQKSVDNGVTWTNSTGQTATTDTLQFTMQADYNKRMFRALVTDENNNTIYSNPVTVVLDGLVRNTDYAQNNASTGGVVKYGNGIYGIKSIGGGTIGIVKPTDAEIEAQLSGWRVLTPAHISKVVKAGLTNNSATLSAAEKQAARDWIGADAQCGEWEKLVDKTLFADSSEALKFADYYFGGNYKKIKIIIRGQMSADNLNILFYRVNSSSSYTTLANLGKAAETIYEFEVEGEPYLRLDIIRPSSVKFKRYTGSSNELAASFKGPIATEMSEINELKVCTNEGNSFLAGTRVVVWGCK